MDDKNEPARPKGDALKPEIRRLIEALAKDAVAWEDRGAEQEREKRVARIER